MGVTSNGVAAVNAPTRPAPLAAPTLSERCAFCGASYAANGRGRPRLYCSTDCKEAMKLALRLENASDDVVATLLARLADASDDAEIDAVVAGVANVKGYLWTAANALNAAPTTTKSALSIRRRHLRGEGKPAPRPDIADTADRCACRVCLAPLAASTGRGRPSRYCGNACRDFHRIAVRYVGYVAKVADLLVGEVCDPLLADEEVEAVAEAVVARVGSLRSDAWHRANASLNGVPTTSNTARKWRKKHAAAAK